MKLKLNHALKKSLYVSINMNYLSLKLDYSPNVCVKSVRPRMVTTNFFLVGCITLHDTSFSICFKEKSVFWHTQFTMTSLLEHSVAQSHSVANYVCTSVGIFPGTFPTFKSRDFWTSLVPGPSRSLGPVLSSENIGWRYINNHSDAQRQYISAKKPFSILFLQME